MAARLVNILETSPSFSMPPASAGNSIAMCCVMLLADIVASLLTIGATLGYLEIFIDGPHPIRGSGVLAGFWLVLLPVLWLNNLYPGLFIHPAEEIRKIVYSVTWVALVVALLIAQWQTAFPYPPVLLLVMWFGSAPAILGSRYLIRRAVRYKKWWGVPVVVLGSGTSAERIIEKLRRGNLGLRLAGTFSEQEVLSGHKDLSRRTAGESTAFKAPHIAPYAILAMTNRTNEELGVIIREYCSGFGHVLLLSNMPTVCTVGITARDIGGELGVELPQRLFHRSAAFLKRGLDIVLSLLILVLLSPIIAAIVIAIKCTSHGPVLFGQSRCGQNGEVFRALKFRTMMVDAERSLDDYLRSNPEYRLEWQRDHKLKHDPRVTSLGKGLRRASLDEIPQLVNVLTGQMSLVGPRPIVSQEIARYGHGYRLYTRVRPGITGLWQVSGRNNTTYEERIAFDEYYVHNWSMWLDLYILLRTVKVVITAEGAY